MSDLNPFDEPLRELKSRIAKLAQQKTALLKEIQWFDSKNEGDLRNTLNVLLNQHSRLLEQDFTIYFSFKPKKRVRAMG